MFSDRDRRLGRKVENVSDIPSVPKSISLLLETHSNRMDGGRECSTLAGFHRAKEVIFLASVVKEAKERMAEIHSNGFLAELAPTNVNEKGTEISVLVQDQNGCIQSRQRFLHQLGDIPVQYQSTALQKGNVKDCGTKQIVLSLSKQYTDKQGWEAAKLAPRVAARRWLQHRAGVKLFDVRPPTRIVGREELQIVAQIASPTYDGLRASGTDGVMTRPFYTTEEEKSHQGWAATVR